MKTQKFSRFKRLACVTLALAGSGLVTSGFLAAEAVDGIRTVLTPETPSGVIIAQSSGETSEPQDKTSSSEGQPSESKTPKNNETAAPKKKAPKDFRPSEQIEAEQAVDFPYDI